MIWYNQLRSEYSIEVCPYWENLIKWVFQVGKPYKNTASFWEVLGLGGEWRSLQSEFGLASLVDHVYGCVEVEPW